MSYRFKITPYRFQVEALKQAILKKKFALWLDPGLGKTKIAIDFCAYYHTKGEINRVLVSCPLSVVGVWEEEIDIHCPVPYEVVTKKYSSHQPNPNVLTFYISSYGYITYSERDEKQRFRWVHLKEFLKLKADCIIIDEAHYIKSPSADRSRGLQQLCKAKEYILELTGTPQPKDFLDLYNQFDSMYPGILGRWTDFKDNIAQWDFNKFKVLRWRGSEVKKLREAIKPYHIRIRKDDVLDLPPRTYQRIPIQMVIDQQDIYNKMKRDSYLKLSEKEEVTADIVLTQYLRLQQIAGGFLTTDTKEIKQIGEAKLWALEELLPTYTAGKRKIVVFCRFLSEIKACINISKKLRLNPLFLVGGMSGEQRNKVRRAFQEAEGYKVLVAQISTGGIGITLTKASTAIFYSQTFSYAEYIQACDRIHRIGQEEPCLYLHLLAKGTIDEYIYKALQRKEELNNLVVNWKEVLHG